MERKVKTPWYGHYKGIRPHLEYPDTSVYGLLEASAGKHPESISYNYFGTKRTYGDFLQEIEECARAFWALGVREGDIVSICMPNTPEGVISFYALNKIGAVASMIHPLSAKQEMEYYLTLTGSKYVVVLDMAFSKIKDVWDKTQLQGCILVSVKDSMPFLMKLAYTLTKERKLSLERNEKTMDWKTFLRKGRSGGGTDKESPATESDRGTECPKKEDMKNRVAAILYSGGTTGYPKGIELTNGNFNALAMQSFEACQCLEQGDTVLAIMPIFHGFGLGICIHTVQYFGGTSILLPQFNAKTFDRLLKKYKPNIIAGVPTLYEALLQSKGMEGYDLSFLKCVISGGDSLSVGLKKKVDAFLKQHGADIQIREGYGLTECVTGSCLTPLDYYRQGSIGIPYPDTYYKIVKPGTREEVPFGEDGEILISGPTVMKGYFREEQETQKVLQKHDDGLVWMYTGDMGCMDEDGFVYFKQRIKRMIISSGYCLYPQYIENVIDSHPKVLLSCVIGIEHPYKKQVAKAYIVLRDGWEADEELKAEIQAYCQERLAKYSWPYAYEYRSELPKTLVGKVAYRVLEEEEKKHAKG